MESSDDKPPPPKPPLLQDPRILKAWEPKADLTVSEWADEHRWLTSLSAEPGQWRTNRVPHAREWMDSANCRWVRKVTLLTGTQISKTETLCNLVGYFVHQDPCPIMFVMPRRDDAKLMSERRLRPMVEASPALRAERTERQADLQSRELAFRNAIVYMRSAQSPADLASSAVRVVLCDELDKWPQWSGEEASPIKLVEERTRTFFDHLIVTASTPTTRRGEIWRQFEAGDQRRYWMPCPHCGKPQTFEFGQVKWDTERIRTKAEMEEAREAWYECRHCSGKIDDRAKRAMVAIGWWVPKGHDPIQWRDVDSKTERHPHRSYHIWAAYSPWIEWWKIVAEHLYSRGVPADRMNFVNSWLAELWEDQVQDTTDAGVRACIGKHRLGEVPAEALVVTSTCDVQVDRVEYHIQAWGRDEQSWLIGVGETNDWEELGDVLFRNTFGEQKLPMRVCLVDSRYRRPEVFEFVRKWPTVARMIAGVERDTPQPFGTTKLEKHPKTGVVLPNSMTVWTVNVGWFKDLVSSRIQRALAEPESKAGRIWLPIDAPDALKVQLASEQKIRQRSGNREVMRWVLKPGHQRNEAWDLQVYQAAAARMIRVDTLRTEATAPQRPAMPPASPRPGPPNRQQRRPGGGPSFPSLSRRP